MNKEENFLYRTGASMTNASGIKNQVHNIKNCFNFDEEISKEQLFKSLDWILNRADDIIKHNEQLRKTK